MKYLFLLLSLFSTQVFAQDQKAQDIINIISQKANSSTSYYYEFSLKSISPQKNVESTNGNAFVKKTNTILI